VGQGGFFRLREELIPPGVPLTKPRARRTLEQSSSTKKTWCTRDLGERARIREESRKPGAGLGPPHSGVRPVRQEKQASLKSRRSFSHPCRYSGLRAAQSDAKLVRWVRDSGRA